ncbi:MAG: TetR family transcriptional regulator, partial [Jatrophihabitantaceae bacterium]|nr:TetR family transcriptional regulator [Jatrophihabitantaceae bacterium]
MERIVAEAKVARATFYPHSPSKDDLVVPYLERIHQHIGARHELAVSGGEPPEDILRDVVQQIVEEIQRPGFRGCAFLNAAAEYPDADLVHRSVLEHRECFRAAIGSLGEP